MPLVSVVVIAYNDAEHLPQALRSLSRQTLSDLEITIVDDGSTDSTAEVAADFARSDSRVTVVRLGENSGGCSRPRNVGLARASSDYVMFLDSDDVLPRRAAERLHAAAVTADADLACGRMLRRHHHPSRFIASNPALYLRPVVVPSLLARPEQLSDTTAVAKLYRRTYLSDNHIEFPEGLLYEDLLFTTEAYCSARGIAVVPDLVYVWNVRRAAVALSITNRRELRNWQDRFEIHRRIDRFLDASGASQDIRSAKNRKFLDVDFALFLRELRAYPQAQRAALVDMAADYVNGADLGGCRQARPADRVGALLAARRDVPRLLLAADFAATGQVGTDLFERDGRLLWRAGHPDGSDAAVELDVTDTGIGRASFAATPFLSVVREATRVDHALRLVGSVVDVLGRLGSAADVTGRLVVTGRVGGALASWPVLVRPASDGLSFTAELDLRRIGRVLGAPTVGHELRLRLDLTRGHETARLHLSARDAVLPDGEIDVPTPWRVLTGDRLRLVERNGRLVLELASMPSPVEDVLAVSSWFKYRAEQLAGRLRSRA